MSDSMGALLQECQRDGCGDEVVAVSSRGWCDGCEEQAARDASCQHPPGDRVREEDGTQVCASCGAVIEVGEESQDVRPAGAGDWIVPADPQSGEGVLKVIPWPPGPNTTPYTPADVEAEILYMIARLNSGARFQAGKERELQEAEVAFELSHARKLLEATGRTVEQRKAWALLQVEEEWTRLMVLRQVVRTTRDGMHTLRQQLTGLQSVARSVGVTGGTGPGPAGRSFQ